MTLRPQSIAQSPASETEGENDPGAGPLPIFASEEPIAALLDGLPAQNHAPLAGRLRVDDPEGLAKIFPMAQREHGTEMASLIITRLLGSGVPDIQRVPDCAENERLCLGSERLLPTARFYTQLPLPDGLDGIRALRGLTTTLAWF